jgi:hypothetical protein
MQTFEEPDDSTIYSVCCSSLNGLLSGNDRFSLIRYWDRRMKKIVKVINIHIYSYEWFLSDFPGS